MNMKRDLAVLRIRKNVPGVGRKVARAFDAQEVVCGHMPTNPLKDGTVVLNYGRSTLPIWFAHAARAQGVTILNRPDAVKKSVDKRTCLELMERNGIPALEMTEDKEVAAGWITKGHNVIIRHIVNGKQGKGVELFDTMGELDSFDDIMAELPDAPMYTKFYDKTHEFRVHVFQGKVIDLVQKKRMGRKKLAARGIGEVNDVARNHKQGWVFAHNDLICDYPDGDGDADNGRSEIEQIGLRATEAVGLDYCGVDILAIFDNNNTFVGAVLCETNSAPGMSSPTTFKAYTDAIEGLLKVG